MFFLHKWNPYSSFLRPKVIKKLTIISLIYAITQISASVKWKTSNVALTVRNFPEISQKIIYIFGMYPYLTPAGVTDLQQQNTFKKFCIYVRNAVIHPIKKKYSHILNVSKMCNGLVSILHVSLHLNGRTSISSAVYHSAISGFTTPKM